ncbi:MAG: HAMP domain-containing protein [Acidobacteria bacterium]|nr:HAMP domain-containing protein [Acidobacteriota bacterium]
MDPDTLKPVSVRARPGLQAWATLLSLGALVFIAFGALLLLDIVRIGPIEDLATPGDTVSLYALSAFNFLAFSIFTFILARMILRLRRERRERQLGSHLKSRLLKYFIVISILPLVFLAMFSYLFINRTVEKWFSNPLDVVMKESDALGRQFDSIEMENLRDMTRSLALLIQHHAAGSSPLTEADLISDQMTSHELFLVRRYDHRGRLVYDRIRTGGSLPDALIPVIEPIAARAMAGSAGSAQFEIPGAMDRFDVAAEPLDDQLGVLLSVYQTPSAVLQKEQRIREQRAIYESLRQQNRQFRKTSLYTLGVITFLLLFVAAWIANRLGKEIADPIQALAGATRRVAGGDLDPTVDCWAEDELGLLVESFNQMTVQLRENRKRLEESALSLQEINRTLEERRRYTETVLESLSTGIISLDSSNCVTTINSAAARILQLKPGLQGQELDSALRAVLSDHRLERVSKLLRTARRRGFATTDLDLPVLSGTQHLAITASSLRDERSEPRGTVITIDDISDLVRAQRSEVWSEVARRMAHEIKNPLTPIKLSAERIARNLERDQGRSAGSFELMIAECTSTIVSEVSTLQRMVDSFTRFARLPETKAVEGSLNQAVEAAVRLYDGRLEGSSIVMTLDPMLPEILIDAEQIKRAIVNLIDNGLESMRDLPGDRRILVETTYLPESETARLMVSDSGLGIRPEIRDKLFTPYFSTRERGMGLGLSIVSRIVADHGGRVRGEDNKPRGARFVIDLPAATPERRPGGTQLIA